MEPHDDTNDLSQAPLLRSLGKVDPFRVPNGFFDTFPQQIQQRITAKTNTKARSGNWLAGPLWPRFALGALAALLIAAGTWLAWPAPDTASVGFASVEPEELLDTGVEDDLLYAALGHEDDLMDPVALSYDDAEVMAYLENENLPLDLLIEDL